MYIFGLEGWQSGVSLSTKLYKFWLLIDGIGLGIIALCTIYEGLEEYHGIFFDNIFSNSEAVLFWFWGLTSAFFGTMYDSLESVL